MLEDRSFVVATVSVGFASLVHAAFTWPAAATVALFGGGAVVAFVAEAVAVGQGALDHHVSPKLAGVPVYVLGGWTGAVYVAFRLALLEADGLTAVVAAAGLATTFDLLTDHKGVEAGYWTYTDDLPGPRFRGVPWWNYLGWFVVSSITAALALAFL